MFLFPFPFPGIPSMLTSRPHVVLQQRSIRSTTIRQSDERLYEGFRQDLDFVGRAQHRTEHDFLDGFDRDDVLGCERDLGRSVFLLLASITVENRKLKSWKAMG